MRLVIYPYVQSQEIRNGEPSYGKTKGRGYQDKLLQCRKLMACRHNLLPAFYKYP